MREYHKGDELSFKCIYCFKIFKGHHAAVCHMPKCPAVRGIVEEAPREPEFKCQRCGRHFSRNLGLSQHRRKCDPVLSNIQRKPKPRTVPKDGKVFSSETVARMLEMEVELAGSATIAKKMEERFGGTLTARQIRDKKKNKIYRDKVAALFSVTPTLEEDTARPVTSRRPPIEEQIVEEEAREEVAEETEEEVVEIPTNTPEHQEWKTRILRTALEAVRPQSSANQHPTTSRLISALEQEINGGFIDLNIDELLAEVTDLMVPDQARRARTSTAKRRVGGREAHRRYEYARAQTLYREQPAKLAAHCKTGNSWLEESVPQLKEEEIRQLYNNLWNPSDSKGSLPTRTTGSEQMSLGDTLTPITIKDLEARLNRTKRKTAAGPDGITKSGTSGLVNKENMMLLFNLILATGQLPRQWLEHRTTLIPKEGKDPTKVTNYRPITVGSIVSRYFWGIIDQKLRSAIKIDPRQKGFVNEMGCFNNIQIVEEVIRFAKKGSGMVGVGVDVSNAFDTVPHRALIPALLKKGIPHHMAGMVKRAYEGVRTKLRQGNTEVEIEIKRGVKQGNPLSR